MKYKCYYNRVSYTFEAETTLEAREKARVRWGIPEHHAHKIAVMLLNEDGTPAEQTPT